jgi:hypothetical protein
MQTRHLKTEEVALLLHGLRTIYVANEEKTRKRLITRLEGELAARGVSLGEPVPLVPYFPKQRRAAHG